MAVDAETEAEMVAINERLVIAAIRQQELAEGAQRSAESALKSGELYRLLVGNFPNGMVLLFDRDLRHILADGRGLAALGLSKEALEGRTLWEGFPPLACRQMEPAYRAALAGETTIIEVLFPAVAPRPAQDTSERIYQLHALPVVDARGEIVTGMAVAQDITEQRRSEATIRQLAHHDALTGLPNRALLRDRLEKVLAMAERTGALAALLFLDLDRFKHINDTWGHAAGDRVLEVVAFRLAGCVRAEDTVARMGGDEFVVLLPRLQAVAEVERVVQNIADLVGKPISVGDHRVSVIASVGTSFFPFDGRDADTLLKHADAAMYRSKVGKQRS